MSSSDSSPSATGHDGLPDFDAAHRLFTAVEENEPNDSSNSGGRGGDFPQIAGYVIDRLLGAGGGGTVYRAVRAGSEHTVAIKLLNRRLGAGHGAPEAQRAWRELHLLSQLRLPCLPHVHDYDEHEGRLYIVTDYVDGLPLGEYCREHHLDREARVKLLAAVADCVQTLHEHGVIHRDIKPANIIINPHGQPIIIDLGIAALLTDDVMDTLTAEGAPIGSPAFMAPEQARGDRNTISTRSDVYSLGATAYYILTGEPPHDMTATIHEAVRRVAQDLPRDPRQLDRTLPKPLASVLWKAVSPKPADRYASAAGFAADLRHWLNREPVEAGGLSLAHRIGRLIDHHPITTTAAACITIALLVFVGTYVSVWYLNARPYEVKLTPDGREARLVSMSGNILHTWETEANGGITFAKLVDRPPELGGGHLALIGFNQSDAGKFRGSLCAFDVARNRTEPLWYDRITDEDMPGDFRDAAYTSEGFGVQSESTVADVFPDAPGKEIIAIYNHDLYSPSFVCIYSMEGELLYQVCHDGAIIDVQWVSGSGQLVVIGNNSEAPWSQRVRHEIQRVHPLVVFALTPIPGHIGEQIVTSTSEAKATLGWYKCVLPPEAVDLIGSIRFQPSPSGDDTSSYVRLSFRMKSNPVAGVSWLVDDTGTEVPGTRVPNDEWMLDSRSRDLANLRLGELPPIISTTE